MDEEFLNTLNQVFTRFNREHYSTEQWRDYGRESLGFRFATLQEMRELGWFMLGLPEECGGSGESITDLLSLFSAAGNGLWREPLLPLLGGSIGAILKMPITDQSRQLIEEMITGDTLTGLAHTESTNGLMSDIISTRATASNKGHLLNGNKSFLLAGEAYNSFLVSARDTSNEDLGLYLVSVDDPSITLSSYHTIDDRYACDLQFNMTPATYLGEATHALASARRRMMILASAEALGIIRAVNLATRFYLAERKQFGRSLSTFQVLQHQLVNMHILEQESSALLADTAMHYDLESFDLERRLLILRTQISRAGRFVTEQSIQLHGGMGMTDELMIGHYYKRCLLLDSLCGSADWAIAKLISDQTENQHR